MRFSPPTKRRPSIPLSIKLEAALRQLGLDPETAELDHDPALGLRKRTDDGGHIPHANDPRYLVWRDPETHDRKTSGPGGEKRITTAGSDIGRMTKIRHLSEAQEAFRARMLAKEPGTARQKTGSIRSRGFPKGKRTMRKQA